MKPAPIEVLTAIADVAPGDIIAGRDGGDGRRTAPAGRVAEAGRDPWTITIQGRPPMQASADWRLWVVTLPTPARQLLDLAHEHGWQTLVNPDLDTDDNLFLTIDVARNDPFIYARLTWHTRDTGGTLRLFSKIWRYVPAEGRGFHWRDAPSLRRVREVIAGQADPV